MSKIKVGTIVEGLGDEMAQVMWEAVKEKLITPYLDIDLKVFDLSLESRAKHGDAIVDDILAAIKETHAGVICSKINPTPAMLKELKINKDLKAATKLIRHGLNCILIREPILCSNVPRAVRSWKKAIIILRHPQYDQYDAAELSLPYPGTLEFVFTDSSGNVTRQKVKELKSKGVAAAIFNTDESIKNFARLSFDFALEKELPLMFTSKHTMLSVYDTKFKTIFDETYKIYEEKFLEKNLTYQSKLTDEMMAHVITSEGGFIWACKNYDGDVQTDIIAQGFGSPGLMTAVMKCPDKLTLATEPYHGTLPEQFQEFKKGNPTSCNPASMIFAWANIIYHRGWLDNDCRVIKFAKILKQACVNTIESGKFTKDLAMQLSGNQSVSNNGFFETFDYLDQIKAELDSLLKM